MLSDKSTATVLVVNHSAHAQQVARELVARKGYQPQTASNAFEALFHLGASRIDAVVCEADLPGRNSQWLRERITQLHPGTLFLVSGSGTGAEWESALDQLRPVATASEAVDTPRDLPGNGTDALTTFDSLTDAEEPELVEPTDDEVSAITVDPLLETQAQRDDRRGAPRYRPSVRLPVLLRGGREGLLRDLSIGGALIETDAHVGPRRLFELRVGHRDMVRTMAQVVRCNVASVSPKGVTYRVGVMFKSPLSEADVRKLVLGDSTP